MTLFSKIETLGTSLRSVLASCPGAHTLLFSTDCVREMSALASQIKTECFSLKDDCTIYQNRATEQNSINAELRKEIDTLRGALTRAAENTARCGTEIMTLRNKLTTAQRAEDERDGAIRELDKARGLSATLESKLKRLAEPARINEENYQRIEDLKNDLGCKREEIDALRVEVAKLDRQTREQDALITLYQQNGVSVNSLRSFSAEQGKLIKLLMAQIKSVREVLEAHYCAPVELR